MDEGYVREILEWVRRLPPLTREQFRALTLTHSNGGHVAELVVAERLYFQKVEEPTSLSKTQVRELAKAFGRALANKRRSDERL